jgi:hypothetical protein
LFLKKYKLDLSVEIFTISLTLIGTAIVTFDLENVSYLVVFTGKGVLKNRWNYSFQQTCIHSPR